MTETGLSANIKDAIIRATESLPFSDPEKRVIVVVPKLVPNFTLFTTYVKNAKFVVDNFRKRGQLPADVEFFGLGSTMEDVKAAYQKEDAPDIAIIAYPFFLRDDFWAWDVFLVDENFAPFSESDAQNFTLGRMANSLESRAREATDLVSALTLSRAGVQLRKAENRYEDSNGVIPDAVLDLVRMTAAFEVGNDTGLYF